MRLERGVNRQTPPRRRYGGAVRLALDLLRLFHQILQVVSQREEHLREGVGFSPVRPLGRRAVLLIGQIVLVPVWCVCSVCVMGWAGEVDERARELAEEESRFGRVAGVEEKKKNSFFQVAFISSGNECGKDEW